MNDFNLVVYILSSKDKTLNEIERCLKSVGTGNFDIFLIQNSNEDSEVYYNFAKNNNIKFCQTPSNGTTNFGHRSCVEHFNQTSYTHMVQIDCDDEYKEGGLDKLIKEVKDKNFDCVFSRNDFTERNTNILYNPLDYETMIKNMMFSLYGADILKYECRPLCLSKKVTNKYNFLEDVKISPHLNFCLPVLKDDSINISFLTFLDVVKYNITMNGATARYPKKYDKEFLYDYMKGLIDQIKLEIERRNLFNCE